MRFPSPVRGPLGQTLLAALTAAALLCCASPALAGPDTAKTDCVYSQHSISLLGSFDSMVGNQVNCAMLYVDGTTTWQQWETPWIDTDTVPDNDWAAWLHAPGTTRQAVITQDLIPSGVADTDWLDAGAAGDFEGYARTFAQNLVNAGFGDAIIRLAPEANGNWFPDSLGSTPAQWAQWIQFWRDTVLAMKSVPGANFQFDWCVNYLYRDLPLSEIYPGSDVVDIIGIDVYDDGKLGSTGAARWNQALNGPDGVQTVIDFAKAEGKPLSIPEWGLDTTSAGGGGDDPAFVQGIAGVVADNTVAYQSYFYKYGHATQLAPGTQSLAAYQAAFGAGGYALGTPPAASAPTTAAPTPPPTAATPTTTHGHSGAHRPRRARARARARARRRLERREHRRLERRHRARRAHHRARRTHHHRRGRRSGRDRRSGRRRR